MLLRGFAQCLATELGTPPPEAAPSCCMATWLGGLLATSLDTFQVA